MNYLATTLGYLTAFDDVGHVCVFGVERGRHDAVASKRGVIDPANITLRVQRELVSPNKWQGRHWTIKHRLSQDWEKALGGGLCDLYVAAGERLNLVAAVTAMSGPTWATGYEAGRMNVSITREVPSGRNFIRDDDNLRFSVKPLLDTLKRLGYIRNDSRQWIELPTPEQRISPDGKYWTEIAITPVDEHAAACG